MAASPIELADGVRRQTLSQAFGQTFLTQVTNPKVAVFFSAIFVSVLPPHPRLWWMMVAILVIVFANEAA